MADIERYLEDGIVDMFEERDEFEPGSKERTQHDKNTIQMVDAYTALKKLERDDFSEERRLEFEKSKVEAQLTHDEKWKAADLNQRIVEHNDESELKKSQLTAEKKTNYARIGISAVGLVVTTGLHILARSDSREGIIADDRLKFIDKAKGFFK